MRGKERRTSSSLSLSVGERGILALDLATKVESVSQLRPISHPLALLERMMLQSRSSYTVTLALAIVCGAALGLKETHYLWTFCRENL